MANFHSLISILVFSSFLAACSSSPKLNKKNILLTANPSEEIQLLNQDIADAREQQVDLFAPTWFEKANKSLQKAKEQQADRAPAKKILDNVSMGYGQLNRAKELAQTAKNNLKTVAKARNLALNAGANKDLDGFTDAEEEFRDFAESVENNSLEESEKEELAQQYRNLELTAIKNEALREARAEIQLGYEMESDELAEISFKEALAELNSANSFIEVNRYNQKGIKSASDKALFQAKRANHLAMYSKYVQDTEPEQVALWVEKQAALLGTSFDTDLRDIELSNQFLQIKEKIDQRITQEKIVSRKARQLSAKLASLEKKSVSTTNTLTQLQKEKAFNQKYEEVRQHFNESEAEVYKDGGKLVIRLKGLNFAIGEAVVQDKNYSLLNKVKTALKTFDTADVLVEGHTDSVGTAKVNNELSMARAQAVSRYLIANDAIKTNDIHFVGLGFSRPVATNKTSSGRAQNRRIDLIINPQTNEVSTSN